MAQEVDGVTTMYFTRARITNDGAPVDIALNNSVYFLWATGSVNNIAAQTINYHGAGGGINNRGVFSERILLPSAEACPAVGKNLGFATVGLE